MVLSKTIYTLDPGTDAVLKESFRSLAHAVWLEQSSVSSAALQALLHCMHTLAPGSSVPCGETGLQGGYRGMWALQNWSFITGLLWAFFGQFLYLTNMVNLRILYVLFIYLFIPYEEGLTSFSLMKWMANSSECLRYWIVNERLAVQLECGVL